MFRNIYPTEVTTIVYSVKNIKTKKKGRKFCVLFSIGSVKYRTDPVEDEGGNPVFDTESVLQVENPKDSLVLVATEKKEKEFYGQLVIPLQELETSRTGQVFQKELDPHKKCPKPTAEIRFEAWISKVLMPSAVTSDIQPNRVEKERKLSGLKKTLAGLVGTPKLSRRLMINRDGRNASFNKTREFSSCMDLPTSRTTSLPNVSGSNLTLNSFKLPREVKVIEEENEEVGGDGKSKAPLISGISPNFGPVQGGTRVVIRGENLGNCRQDVVGLFVCGSNVLATLEYFSPSKIACSTKPWRAGEGTITVETQSGGKCKSSIKFTFEGEVKIDVCDVDSDYVKRSESLKDSRGEQKAQKHTGTPQMPRANLPSERGLLGSRHLGISGFSASRSMLDLTAAEAGNSTLHASNSSHVLFENTNQKKGNVFRHPPVMPILPMRLYNSTVKSNKSPGKSGSGTHPSLFKDLQEELGGCQTINCELRLKAHELEDENKRLKEYIENLLSKIMIKCPEMLCNDRK